MLHHDIQHHDEHVGGGVVLMFLCDSKLSHRSTGSLWPTPSPGAEHDGKHAGEQVEQGCLISV